MYSSTTDNRTDGEKNNAEKNRFYEDFERNFEV